VIVLRLVKQNRQDGFHYPSIQIVVSLMEVERFVSDSL